MNAPSPRDRYMSGAEIARAISTISTLAAEVIKHSNHLEPVIATANQPRSKTTRFPRMRKQHPVTVAGYAFGDESDHAGLIVEYDNRVLIATRYEFPSRRRNRYILLDASDYVSTWIVDEGFISGDDARKVVAKVLFQIEQLLPDGHVMKHAYPDADSLPELYAGSSLEY